MAASPSRSSPPRSPPVFSSWRPAEEGEEPESVSADEFGDIPTSPPLQKRSVSWGNVKELSNSGRILRTRRVSSVEDAKSEEDDLAGLTDEELRDLELLAEEEARERRRRRARRRFWGKDPVASLALGGTFGLGAVAYGAGANRTELLLLGCVLGVAWLLAMVWECVRSAKG